MAIINLVVLGVFIVNDIIAIITVFREKRDIAATWAWLLVLTLIPVVGFIFYLFAGKKISQEKIWFKNPGTDRLSPVSVSSKRTMARTRANA